VVSLGVSPTNLPCSRARLRISIMLERDTPAELFEILLHAFRAHEAKAGDSLPVSLLLEAFLSDTAALDLEEALRYGLTHHLIVRAAGSGHRVALTEEGAKRAKPRTKESGSSE
jgi:hypothetical protein